MSQFLPLVLYQNGHDTAFQALPISIPNFPGQVGSFAPPGCQCQTTCFPKASPIISVKAKIFSSCNLRPISCTEICAPSYRSASSARPRQQSTINNHHLPRLQHITNSQVFITLSSSSLNGLKPGSTTSTLLSAVVTGIVEAV